MKPWFLRYRASWELFLHKVDVSLEKFQPPAKVHSIDNPNQMTVPDLFYILIPHKGPNDYETTIQR